MLTAVGKLKSLRAPSSQCIESLLLLLPSKPARSQHLPYRAAPSCCRLRPGRALHTTVPLGVRAGVQSTLAPLIL